MGAQVKEVEALLPGDRCGPFEIVREIGRGGMGIVYLATGPNGEQRAIKTLQFAGNLRGEMLERFKREIRLLARLVHVHIVRFYDAGRIPSRRSGSIIWVALEYLEGKTLREIISEQSGRIDVGDIARWGMHVADGVAAAHQAGIIHRDLKPENIAIVTETGKVFDFGIAKYREWVKTTDQQLRLGTLGYMAPEQFDRDRVDGRTDIYALGLILYEMATGHNPITIPGEPLAPAQVMARTLMYEPPPLVEVVPGYPAELSAITARAMRKHKEDRFESMQALSAALEAFLLRHLETRHAETLVALSGEWELASLGSSPESLAQDVTVPDPSKPARIEVAKTEPVRADELVAPPEQERTSDAAAARGSWTPGQKATVKLGVAAARAIVAAPAPAARTAPFPPDPRPPAPLSPQAAPPRAVRAASPAATRIAARDEDPAATKKAALPEAVAPPPSPPPARAAAVPRGRAQADHHARARRLLFGYGAVAGVALGGLVLIVTDRFREPARPNELTLPAEAPRAAVSAPSVPSGSEPARSAAASAESPALTPATGSGVARAAAPARLTAPLATSAPRPAPAKPVASGRPKPIFDKADF